MRKLKRNKDRKEVVVHELLSNARINIEIKPRCSQPEIHTDQLKEFDLRQAFKTSSLPWIESIPVVVVWIQSLYLGLTISIFTSTPSWK